MKKENWPQQRISVHSQQKLATSPMQGRYLQPKKIKKETLAKELRAKKRNLRFRIEAKGKRAFAVKIGQIKR